MAVSNEVAEARQEFTEKQKYLADVFELAKDGNRFDFERKNVLERLGVPDKGLEKVKQINREIDDLSTKLAQVEAKAIEESITERDRERNTPVRGGEVVHPITDTELKSFGGLYVATKEFAESRRSRTTVPVVVDINIKTLFQTSAGFAPESTRTGRVVEAATRPIQVLDLIPSAPMNQAVEKYMEQTTRTHGAAERAEGGAYAESTFVYAEKTSDVRSIGDSIPVTDEQLEDESQVSGLLDQQLRFGVRQRLDGQVLTGTGVSPNLRGINNVTGIQTQAKGTDSAIVAFLRALTKIRFTGRAMPSGAIFHPNDWQDILLTQDANGNFLFGNPFMGPGPQSLFGIPVAQSDAQTENTGLVGDFANFCRIGERRGVEVQIGYVGTQFTEGKKTIRAELRAAFTVYRPAAFCQISGI
jgi:HK97 family phage major capsid protein